MVYSAGRSGGGEGRGGGLRAVGAVRVKGVGGRVLRAQQATLALVKAGPASREELSVVILRDRGGSSFGDGLLGMDFLRGFKYTIDFDRQLIVWKP